jgi:hypothetical protein
MAIANENAGVGPARCSMMATSSGSSLTEMTRSGAWTIEHYSYTPAARSHADDKVVA